MKNGIKKERFFFVFVQVLFLFIYVFLIINEILILNNGRLSKKFYNYLWNETEIQNYNERN